VPETIEASLAIVGSDADWIGAGDRAGHCLGP
jgi:hypothetical protein